MPIPENPQSRSEQYLAAIATGDNSGLPAFPESRMEQYLEVIAQNGGGGGGGGGVLVVHYDYKTGVLDKTWQEIHDAAESGAVVIVDEGNINYLTNVLYAPPLGQGAGTWITCFAQLSQEGVYIKTFNTTEADGYPVFANE